MRKISEFFVAFSEKLNFTVCSTQKKSISSKQIKRKKGPRQLQGGLSMMCFCNLLHDFEISRLDNIIDIEISNSSLACLEISKPPSAATAAGGKKPHH